VSAADIVTVLDEGLGNSSYLVDLGDGAALVVDPGRDARPYVAEAERRGLRVVIAAETHLHADFVSGSRELAALGARVVAARAARLEHPHHGLTDGDALDLGGLSLEAVATPGHTPEHVAYLLRDGGRPLALFSGGSLLTGAVARTDLVSPERTEALARALWQSIQQRLLSLPDDLPVYPTHGAGSFCSVAPSGERATTIGRERSTNPLLAAPGEDEFVARLLAGFGSFPPYFLELRELNRMGPLVYGQFPALSVIGVDSVQRLLAAGAVAVDVRPVEAFAAGHLPGSLSIPLRPQFGSWLGWLVGRDHGIVFVVGEDQDRDELVRQCLTIGYERLCGEVAGGADAWRLAGMSLATVPLVVPDGASGTLVDVRQSAEFGRGHVPGAINLELGDLLEHAWRLPPGPLTVMCGHGERAMSAASVLAARGRTDVSVLVGGPADVAATRRHRLRTR